MIWVTGLSGSGKTTLCDALWRLLKPKVPALVSIDGDVIREAFGQTLGFREEDRIVQITRLQNLAKILSDQRLSVLVAALYASPALLNWNRTNIPDYFEVYLQASLDTVKRRDSKGLYGGAAEQVANVVGIDIPWNAPERPDLTISTDAPASPETMAQQVIDAVPVLANPRGEK